MLFYYLLPDITSSIVNIANGYLYAMFVITDDYLAFIDSLFKGFFLYDKFISFIYILFLG